MDKISCPGGVRGCLSKVGLDKSFMLIKVSFERIQFCSDFCMKVKLLYSLKNMNYSRTGGHRCVRPLPFKSRFLLSEIAEPENLLYGLRCLKIAVTQKLESTKGDLFLCSHTDLVGL